MDDCVMRRERETRKQRALCRVRPESQIRLGETVGLSSCATIDLLKIRI